MTLEAELIMNIHVSCDKPYEVGNDGGGFLRVIPILGGTFDGKVSGTIIPGSADFNTQKSGYSHAFAKYLLKTDDGEYIAVENEGNMEDSMLDVIKTTPRFKVDKGSKYNWLNSGVYVAALNFGEKEGQIEITVYRMR